MILVILARSVVLQASSVRLPLESGTQRLRGFGYAEFDNINDLKEALLLKGEVSANRVVMLSGGGFQFLYFVLQTLLNRPVQIDIADGKGGGSSGQCSSLDVSKYLVRTNTVP